jgi:hypothetical protein
MPFNCLETVSNTAHRGLTLLRIGFGLNPEHFIAILRQAGLDLQTAKDANGRTRLCQLCGFALAYCQLNEQWSMEACSATGFKEIKNQPAFADWLKRLSEGGSAESGLKIEEHGDLSQLPERSYTCH